MATVSPAMSGKVCKEGIRGLGNLGIGVLKVKLLGPTTRILRVFFNFKSKRLPSWDVANYLNVVSRVQRGGIGHTCSNNHLKKKV